MNYMNYMNSVGRFKPLNLIKRNLFVLQKPSKIISEDINSYIDFVCPYNQTTSYVLSMRKPTNHIVSTFVKIENLEKVSDIYYLDSYLSTFHNSFNTVGLMNPNLINLYMYLTERNIYRTQNEFIIYNLQNTNLHNVNNVIQKLHKINKITGSDIWDIRAREKKIDYLNIIKYN